MNARAGSRQRNKITDPFEHGCLSWAAVLVFSVVPDVSMTVLHVDMDAFFASIEQRDNPELKGKAVVVGARPGTRGVVSAASYEARKFGIHSAMPIGEAWSRCPRAVFVGPRMKAYAAASARLITILHQFSPDIEQVSVDEAFVDLSGTGGLWGRPVEAARKILARIGKELSLSASIGVAPNKFLAKIASDMDKPGGITVVPDDPDAVVEWLAPQPVAAIWGVGNKTRQRLQRYNVHTIGDLQKLPRRLLRDRFGAHGTSLYNLARGIDHRRVADGERAKSISREHTFNEDCSDEARWKSTLLSLAGDVCRRCRRAGVKGGTVVLTWRTPDFARHSRRKSLPVPTDLTGEVYAAALELLRRARVEGSALRLIGVGMTGFNVPVQLELFEEIERKKEWEMSESAMDAIKEKFGENAIFLGGENRP